MRAGIRRYSPSIGVAIGIAIAPCSSSAQVQLSSDAAGVLQQEGLKESYFGGVAGLARQVEIGPDSRSDRAAMLAGCEAVMAKDFQSVARQFGYDQALLKSSNILASAVDALKQARAGSEGRKLLDETSDVDTNFSLGRYGELKLGYVSGSESTFACFLRVAKGLVSGQPRTSAPATPFLPPPARVAPPPPETSGASAASDLALRDREVARLGLPTVNALDAVLGRGAPPVPTKMPAVDSKALSWDQPATGQAKRDYAVGQQQFAQAKQRKVHNQANDATSCIRVEPTGVVSEWGMEGRFRLRNTCEHPIAASWCANRVECDAGRGNLWTVQPGTAWPIFSANHTDPAIQVAACKAGAAKEPPLGEQGVERAGYSEARQPPQAAAGVSLMPSHHCD